MSPARARVAQITDTHIVAEGSAYFGIDTASYLSRALAAVGALDPLPDYLVVTGDLTNTGAPSEYVRFRELMRASPAPYFVIPGNHDDRDALRATLDDPVFGAAHQKRVRYAVAGYPIRLVGIDCNTRRPWPGAVLDGATFGWLAATLAADDRPTIVAVHQPPFRTGLHYLDLGGFIGRRKLRRLVDRNASVRAVISGHIHCSRSRKWRGAVASSAPSTAPQSVPLLCTQGRILGVARETPGFAVFDLEDDGALRRTEYRLAPDGNYAATRPRL